MRERRATRVESRQRGDEDQRMVRQEATTAAARTALPVEGLRDARDVLIAALLRDDLAGQVGPHLDGTAFGDDELRRDLARLVLGQREALGGVDLDQVKTMLGTRHRDGAVEMVLRVVTWRSETIDLQTVRGAFAIARRDGR